MADKGDTKKKGKGDKPAAAAAKPAAAAPAPAPVKAAPVVHAAPPHAAPPPAAAAAAVAPEKQEAHGFRRKLVGRVTSDKMKKTVTVEVIRSAMDPVYKKYVRMRDRYKAHDETNQYKIGDRVEIQEHRPISREKRWLVTKLIARAVQE
jgi:small subunit ribosomal protein S17